jgi:hypothetical protein
MGISCSSCWTTAPTWKLRIARVSRHYRGPPGIDRQRLSSSCWKGNHFRPLSWDISHISIAVFTAGLQDRDPTRIWERSRTRNQIRMRSMINLYGNDTCKRSLETMRFTARVDSGAKDDHGRESRTCVSWDVYLTGMHLIDVHLIDVSHRRASHRHASHRRVSHQRVSHACIS